MAPESATQVRGATSSAHLTSTSSSDSDSGCALEEYPDLEARPSDLNATLSNGDIKELKLIRTLLQLLPPQDCDERFCTALGEQERRELQRFSAHRRLHCMRRGVTSPVTQETPNHGCMRCGVRIKRDEIAVHTDQAQEDGLFWHLGCFVCETCHLPLSQFIFFLQDGKIYCGRHHAELSRARCAACDQLILSERCIVAEGHRWHVEHFRCWECDKVLGGSRYVMKGGRPFCSNCFLCLYAENCESCGEPVSPDGDLVTFRGQYWHASPACFCCSSCMEPLQVAKFKVLDGQVYCPHRCSPCSSQDHYSDNSQRNVIDVAARVPSPQRNTKKISTHLNCGQSVTFTQRDMKGLILSMQDSSSVTSCEEESTELCKGRTNDPVVSRLKENIQGIEREEEEEEEDTSCSSTDSEPEGFFLGTPIPNFPISGSSPSPVRGKTSSLKRRQRGKNCKVS
ncbi:prickle-like protein 4 [Discoglossus pictus]